MATSTKKAAGTKAPAKKSTAGRPKDPTTAAIAAAARDLERDVSKTVRAEFEHLHDMVGTLQDEAKRALDRVEKALDLKPSTSTPTRRGPKPLRPGPTRKSAAKKAGAKK